MRHHILSTSINQTQGFYYIQEHDNLLKCIYKAANKLVILSTSHEPLENGVDMLAIYPHATLTMRTNLDYTWILPIERYLDAQKENNSATTFKMV
jgi:hypothetical protein